MSEKIITVALNKLDADPLNVRKTYSAESIKELAASIKAKGIIQNLAVRKAGNSGKYLVSAGGRRLKAAQYLAEAGDLAADYPINCKVVTEAEAREISLAENVMREAMHPVDQFEAFSALAAEGMTIADIAVRFGTTDTIVKKRLALARVAPELLELCRKDEINLDQLAAFTITDDHERQLHVWNSLGTWDRSSRVIRRALAADGVPGSDRRVRFLGGLDAFAAAGGPVRRDLFDPHGGYADDAKLLDELVAAQLEKLAEAARADGWKWAETAFELEYRDLDKYGRRYPTKVELTEEEQADLDELTARYDDLAAVIEAGNASDTEVAEVEKLQEQISYYDREEFSDVDKAATGVIFTLNHLGKLRVEYGLERPEDMAQGEQTENSGDSVETGPKGLQHSAALIEDLSAQKTAALRVEFANNPDVALVAVVHNLLLQVAYDRAGYHGEHTALEISLTHTHIERQMKSAEGNTALAELERLTENYRSRIPGNPADLWDWCLGRDQSELLNLLAYAASCSLNVVQGGVHPEQTIKKADQIGAALEIDMHDYFRPTAENYFKHLKRDGIEAAVVEAKGEDFAAGIAAMKKADAAAFAEKQLAGSDWLPAPIQCGEAKQDETDTVPKAAE